MGEPVYDHKLAQDEAALRRVKNTSLQDECGSILVIADTVRTMPHTLRSADRDSAVLANLKALTGADEGLVHDITRAINRLRSLLLRIRPALERFKGTVLTRSIVLDLRIRYRGPAGRVRVIRQG